MINHLAIIMDGNRRWAKSKFLPSFAGHKAGADNVDRIASLAMDKGIKYLTLWGLSNDNLKKRDKKEIEGIIKIINSTESFLGEMILKNIKFQVIGNIEELPKKSQQILESIVEKTKNNTGITFTIALIYGGQDEIVRATKKIIKKGLDPEKITREEFRKYLDTNILPVPDIIVRTGGDTRHSGFLLYDSEYSEYYFTKKQWPEFNEEDIDKVIECFKKSKRNFGK